MHAAARYKDEQACVNALARATQDVPAGGSTRLVVTDRAAPPSPREKTKCNTLPRANGGAATSTEREQLRP